MDVGSSLGYYTVLAGRSVGTTDRAISYEPGLQNHSLLLLNIFQTQYCDVDVSFVAISNSTEILAHNRFVKHAHASCCDGSPSMSDTRDLVLTSALGEILESQKRIHFIKIEVAGAEARVVQGVTETLLKLYPFIFFEFTPQVLETNSAMSGRVLLDRLINFGHEFTVLPSQSVCQVSPTTQAPSQVLQLLASSKKPFLDVLAIP